MNESVTEQGMIRTVSELSIAMLVQKDAKGVNCAASWFAFSCIRWEHRDFIGFLIETVGISPVCHQILFDRQFGLPSNFLMWFPSVSSVDWLRFLH